MRVSPVSFSNNFNTKFGKFRNKESKDLTRKILTADPSKIGYKNYQDEYNYAFDTIEKCPYYTLAITRTQGLEAFPDYEYILNDRVPNFEHLVDRPVKCNKPHELTMLARNIRAYNTLYDDVEDDPIDEEQKAREQAEISLIDEEQRRARIEDYLAF